MSDPSESPKSSEELSLSSDEPKKVPAKKKSAKKTAKKAAKKSVKKAAKKSAKKSAKKAAKKVAKPKAIEPELPGLDSEPEAQPDEKPNEIVDLASKKESKSSNADQTQKEFSSETPATSESDDEIIKEIVEKKSPPPPEVPEFVSVSEFRLKSLAELYEEIERLPLRIPAQATKSSLIFLILGCYASHGTRVVGAGVLEMVNENYGMLRDPQKSFRPDADDFYVPAPLVKELGLRQGQYLEVVLNSPKGRDKYLSVGEVLKIEGQNLTDFEHGTPFDFLTSLFPEERFVLEKGKEGGLAVRVVDLIAPLGKGQRGLIVAPPRGGKTILLKQIAQSIQHNHPESELIILLLDERPEEVTDFEDMVSANVFASTFDEASKRHAQVASLVLERARRLVEQKKDVIILLDSLTRLARGYNNASRGGPIGSGGVSPKAITECRKFFGAARNVEQGGSLSILATCLVETESRMDDVIFEELKGTGNMEIRLDRILAEQRIYPAIHIPQSGTRNDDRLYHEQELPRVLEIRRHLAALPIGEALEVLLANLSRTETNAELLLKGMR